MEQKHNHSTHSGGGGFLVGVIVGVIITLLFTTKRGRSILKDVTEKGIEKFSDLEKLMHDEDKREIYEEEETDYIKSEPVEEVQPAPKQEESKKEVKPAVSEEIAVVKVKEEKKETSEEKPQKSSGGKRWFRGLKKKN